MDLNSHTAQIFFAEINTGLAKKAEGHLRAGLAAARRYVATLQRCSAKGSRRFPWGNFTCRPV